MRNVLVMCILAAVCCLPGCDESDNKQSPAAVCGNGIIEAGESCDSDNFGDLTCDSVFSGTKGNLECSSDCQIDFSGCTEPKCVEQNGRREGNEECDGEDFGTATCASVIPDKPFGRLGCTQKCQISTTFCAVADLGLQAPNPDVEQTDALCSDGENNFKTVNKDGTLSSWFDCKNHSCLTSPFVQICQATENSDAACSDKTDNPNASALPGEMSGASNGLIDCQDPSCFKNWRVTVCEKEAPKWELGADCGDGADNDGDTLADCNDPDCLHAGMSDCELGDRVRVLFDNSHHQIAGSIDWIIDVTGRHPFPSKPTTETQWHGSLSSLGLDLLNTGRFVVETLPQDRSFTYKNAAEPQDLSGYHILVIDEPSSKLSDAEIAAVHQFVADGGSLLLFADHKGADRDGNNVDAVDAINDMLAKLPGATSKTDNPFGFHALENTSMSNDTAVVAEGAADHPVIKNTAGTVATTGSYAGTAFQITDTSKVKPLLKTKTGNQNYAIAVEYENGRIVAVGDSSIAGDGTNFLGISLNNAAYKSTTLDNRIFLLNAFEWLHR